MSAIAKRTKSGQNEVVTAYRRKLESISDAQSPALQKLTERAEKLERKLSPALGSAIDLTEITELTDEDVANTIPVPPPPPRADPRRDGDSLIPVDVVEIEE